MFFLHVTSSYLHYIFKTLKSVHCLQHFFIFQTCREKNSDLIKRLHFYLRFTCYLSSSVQVISPRINQAIDQSINQSINQAIDQLARLNE